MSAILSELQTISSLVNLLKKIPNLDRISILTHLDEVKEHCVIWWDMTENQFTIMSGVFS
jgi:hypothetical protein